MTYRIKNTLIPIPESHRKPLLATLEEYDRGKDLTNSPLIRSRVNLTHMDVYFAKDKEKALQERQGALIALYKSIKSNGYNGSSILVWFDDEGNIHLYDGYHRLAVLEHLGIVTDVNTKTDWQGIDHSVGKDFPLVETLLKEPPRGEWLYQPINDKRVKDWKLARNDTPQRLDYILQNLTGKTVLDIGCSEGYFSREIAKRGYEVVAIDDRPGLIASARYLTILSGLDIDYLVTDWRDLLKDGRKFDNILFLSIIHNNMKKDGVAGCLEKLKLFRGKATRVFFEVPNNTNERQWMVGEWPKYDFHSNIDSISELLNMKVIGSYIGQRKTYLFGPSPPWWSLEAWMNPIRTHYSPLFETLRTTPCRNIMEVGVFDGVSAVVMVKEAAKKVPEDEIHFYGFDLFEEMTPRLQDEEFSFRGKLPPKMEEVKAFIENNTTAKVTLFKGNTRETLKEAVKSLPLMDLIYIDGGHTIKTVKSDWKYSSKLMHKGTIVYFDDYCDEMPFIGAKCIIDELSPKYSAEVMQPVNYYPRVFGRLKSQLLKVEVKDMAIKKAVSNTSHFRFHLLGLAHSKTTKDWVMCPFTQLTYKMAEMLVGMGHEVYHYGTEGSNPPCTEQVNVLTDAVQKQAYGDFDPKKQLWVHNGNDLAYSTFKKNAIEEIKLRQQPKDLLLISIGNWYKPVADALPGMPAIEPYVGHLGSFAKYKVFPTYAWMHHIYGITVKSTKENFAMGQWYDAVIPHYFNPEDFKFCSEKEDYFLYVGRLITRKGVHVASQVCKAAGVNLIVTGQVLYPDKKEECLHQLGLDQPHVEYLEPVSRERRNELMGKAKAVFVPSLYLEPFGKVVIEALLCGTPVITTDWGSFPELVKHGEVGYRCRTMDDFLWAVRNIDKINPKRCREYSEVNYSMERISLMYQEYFTKIYDLFSGGWYAEHPERKDLDWLRKY